VTATDVCQEAARQRQKGRRRTHAAAAPLRATALPRLFRRALSADAALCLRFHTHSPHPLPRPSLRTSLAGAAPLQTYAPCATGPQLFMQGATSLPSRQPRLGWPAGLGRPTPSNLGEFLVRRDLKRRCARCCEAVCGADARCDACEAWDRQCLTRSVLMVVALASHPFCAGQLRRLCGAREGDEEPLGLSRRPAVQRAGPAGPAQLRQDGCGVRARSPGWAAAFAQSHHTFGQRCLSSCHA
jgi:hypothetical protein